jgi:hypothetical protein
MFRPLPAIAASLVLAACERGFLPLGGRFEIGRDPMVIFVGGDAPAGGDLYALQTDGGGAIPITFTVVGEMRPSLGPDGGQVAFLRGGSLTDSTPATVWVLNLVNGAERQVGLPPRAGPPEQVGWSDGRTLVVRARGGVYRAPAPLAEEASDAARWGDDSVAFLTGGRLMVRPVGPGRLRVVEWSAIPARPRQLTVFPGASEPR